jgi:hypothetical protein
LGFTTSRANIKWSLDILLIIFIKLRKKNQMAIQYFIHQVPHGKPKMLSGHLIFYPLGSTWKTKGIGWPTNIFHPRLTTYCKTISCIHLICTLTFKFAKYIYIYIYMGNQLILSIFKKWLYLNIYAIGEGKMSKFNPRCWVVFVV